MSNKINPELFYAGKRHKIVCAGDCYHVKNIKPENQLIYASLEEAINDGCRPCKHCHGIPKTLNNVRVKKAEKRTVIQNQTPHIFIPTYAGQERIAFGLMGDTHIGSKYSQLTYLHAFYKMLADLNITNVYHAGDITDGLKMRNGHEYELCDVSADDMIKDVVKNYPQIVGITTHFITGNHDASIYKHIGYDIGPAIQSQRTDMHYLGRDCAVVNLTPNCTLELRHPWDASAYALSYRPQKMIEAMEADTKPNILAIGNYHKAEYIFYRNVHCFQTACFQAQTPFMRGKSISAHLGGWIVDIRVDSNGTIRAIVPTFIPYYKSITDDYKKFI